MARKRKRIGYVDTRSTGAAIWEMLHPDQVQREYAAVGKPVPSYGDIYESAINDAITAGRESVANAEEAAGNVVEGLSSGAKFALVAFGLYVALQIFGKEKR